MKTLTETAAISKKSCEVLLPGLLPYQQAIVLQESYVQKVAGGEESEKFILLEHPHVITLGRGFHPSNLLFSVEWFSAKGISVVESGRGGDVTYHGPGQVVGYPILNLKEQPDLHLYLRRLEELMIRAVGDFGIQADRKKGMTGIWVGEEKLGAIGVRVVRWVSSHGFALNVNTDLDYFQYIIPCGIQNMGVTSMQKILKREIPLPEVQASLLHHFEIVFSRHLVNPLD